MIVTANGEAPVNWSAGEGQVTKAVPPPYGNIPNDVHFHAQGSPNGRNATCKFLWDGNEKHEMNFDNGEDWDSEV
jgi:hypothetical protein